METEKIKRKKLAEELYELGCGFRKRPRVNSIMICILQNYHNMNLCPMLGYWSDFDYKFNRSLIILKRCGYIKTAESPVAGLMYDFIKIKVTKRGRRMLQKLNVQS